MADTGNSATVTFGSSGFTGQITSIDIDSWTRPVLSRSHLGTTGFERKAPGDLVDAGSFTLELYLNPNEQPPYNGAPETVTITFPIPDGDTNGATLAGTAFVTDFKAGKLENNANIMSTVKVTWDGNTGPAWTDSN